MRKIGGAADRRVRPPEAPQLLGGQAPTAGGQRIRDEEPLASHPLTGGGEAVGGGKAEPIHGERLAQARLSIMCSVRNGSGLVLQGVSAGYGAGPVLQEVDLAIPRARSLA